MGQFTNKMNNNEISHINEIIKKLFRKRNWTQRIDGYDIFSHWNEILPKKISQNTKPIKIQNNTLFIMVKNHIWGNEINIQKGEIINSINKVSNNSPIDDIIVTINLNKFNNK